MAADAGAAAGAGVDAGAGTGGAARTSVFILATALARNLSSIDNCGFKND